VLSLSLSALGPPRFDPPFERVHVGFDVLLDPVRHTINIVVFHHFDSGKRQRRRDYD
jgi:hypothetical protein